MGRLAIPALATLAMGIALTGCGGDDGLAGSEAPELNTPAEGRGGESLPSVDGDGLLYPDGKKPVKKRASKKHGTKQDGKKHKKRGRKHEKQQVAGVNESSDATRGSLTPNEDDDTTPQNEAAPTTAPLTKDQEADLNSVGESLAELFRRMNARDASVCTELMTQRHVEQATGKSGPAAVDQCRSDVATSKISYSLNKIAGTRIEGDLAWITFASSAGDYARWQTLRAVRSGIGWRFDGDGSADV